MFVRMGVADLLPAAGLGGFVSVSVAAAQLAPCGVATVLVRVPDNARGAALAAAASGAYLLSVPAPGYAVLRGDAARIRQTLGLAVSWQGAGCGTHR